MIDMINMIDMIDMMDNLIIDILMKPRMQNQKFDS